MTAILFALTLLQGSTGMTTLDRGAMSGIDRPTQQVIRTADEWQALWRRHESAKPLPTVDFGTEMVLGLTLGSRPSAGWDVEITGAAPQGDGLLVKYAEHAPAPGRVAASVITSPYHFVKVPKVAGKVVFEKVETK